MNINKQSGKYIQKCCDSLHQALVHRAEDVLHVLAESMSPVEIQAHGEWIMQLDRVKGRFFAAVNLPYQTLKAVSDFYYYYNKVGVSSVWISLGVISFRWT